MSFVPVKGARVHLRTHVRAEHRGRYTHGDSECVDGMIEHDDTIGSLLKALDDMGIANNTIVIYTSDNGPHMNTWPAMTWFRSEKNTNWEGHSVCHHRCRVLGTGTVQRLKQGMATDGPQPGTWVTANVLSSPPKRAVIE